MKTLIATIGLPRSGKTTFCQSMTDYPVVNPDAIRMALGCYPFKAEREAEVWKHVKVFVDSLFAYGHDTVVLDATNCTALSHAKWTSDKYETIWVHIDTPILTCLNRANASGQLYLLPVIERMAANLSLPVKNLFSVDEFKTLYDLH